jgi:hypothetical protein
MSRIVLIALLYDRHKHTRIYKPAAFAYSESRISDSYSGDYEDIFSGM